MGARLTFYGAKLLTYEGILLTFGGMIINNIKQIRERSSGRNIFDAEQTVISKNEDGTIKKSMIKETYANITIRKKRQRESDGQSSNNHEISGALFYICPSRCGR